MKGGFLSMLTVLFIGLKLTGHIDWRWGYVLMPLWGPLLLVATIWLSALVSALAERNGTP